ncbi:MAG TPA: glycosyltransferase WbuB [Micavibrio sp.]|nr:glycosyltransferase WbuB [Micavibrio sp.]HIL29711.1 glycosyltransferase WbuB [Micavibrio sp.]
MAAKQPNKKPSVLFVNRVYPPYRGATGRVLRDLARGFAAKGWDVTVVTSAPEKRIDRDGTIKVIRTKASMKRRNSLDYMTVWVKLLATALMQPRHDLLVTMTDPPLLVVAGRVIASLKKSRHIHWCQDLFPDIVPALGFSMKDSRMSFYKKISRKAMKQCDKVVTVGRCMAKHLTHTGLEPNRVAVIPNWPDYELLPAPANDMRGRRRRPLRKISKAEGARPFDELRRDGTERKFRVLYSGNLGRAHPIDTVLEAAAILGKEYPEIEFTFIGDGQNFERLAIERAKRRLENIRLLPFQPISKIRDIMTSGDLHLITMKHEASGMIVPSKLYSALAVGRPCILVGPEDSETAQVIKDFKAGRVVPQGDSHKLAAAIKEYRLSSDAWFAAHEGAVEAGQIFVPEQSIDAWIERAYNIVSEDKVA